jgi:hypothetical protein
MLLNRPLTSSWLAECILLVQMHLVVCAVVVQRVGETADSNGPVVLVPDDNEDVSEYGLLE